MRPEEISAAGELVGDAVRGGALQAHGLHCAIAGRVWRAVGPMALPVRIVHDAIARGAYAAAGEAGRVLVRGGAGAVALAAAVAPGEPARGSLEDSARGRAVVAVLNGAVGDTLSRRGNRLALPMTLRHRGHDVPMSPDALRLDYPDATARLALFVHGLGQTEEAWNRHADRHVPYGYRLRVELGYTPLFVRYNSGRHISENGRELAALLDGVTAAWRCGVEEIALVGHSVGGLVARSACHYGAGRSWTRTVRHVVTLGSAHAGTPLERVTAAAGAALARVPEARPAAKALELRSAGLKDAGRGYLIDEDWLGGAGPAHQVPFLETANHYFVSAGPPVPRTSAWAQGDRRAPVRFSVDRYRHLAGLGHFDLLNHPAVHAQIREWLTGGRLALPPGSEAPGN